MGLIHGIFGNGGQGNGETGVGVEDGLKFFFTYQYEGGVMSIHALEPFTPRIIVCVIPDVLHKHSFSVFDFIEAVDAVAIQIILGQADDVIFT